MKYAVRSMADHKQLTRIVTIIYPVDADGHAVRHDGPGIGWNATWTEDADAADHHMGITFHKPIHPAGKESGSFHTWDDARDALLVAIAQFYQARSNGAVYLVPA